MKRTIPLAEARQLYARGWGWAEMSRILAERHKPAFRPEVLQRALACARRVE